MAHTDINSKDQLLQDTFADHLRAKLASPRTARVVANRACDLLLPRLMSGNIEV
jgi:hypothetical protein